MSKGVVYLLHFDFPYCHARHYMGYSVDLDQRLKAHRNGRGARLIEVITAAGTGFSVARTWNGDRHLERSLKRRKKSPALCPICLRAGKARRSRASASRKPTCRN